MADRVFSSEHAERDTTLLNESQSRPTPRLRAAAVYRSVGRRMAVTDALSVALAIVIVRLIRLGFERANPSLLLVLILGPVIWVALGYAFELYSLQHLSSAEEFRRVLEASGASLLISLLVIAVSRRGEVSSIGLSWFVLAWLVAMILCLASRQAWHKHLGRLRQRGELASRTLILGANEEAVRLAEALMPKTSGYVPVGLVRTNFGWVEEDVVPIVGSVEELDDLIEDQAIESVFIASSAVDPDLMRRLTKGLRRQELEVRVSANLTDILSSRLVVLPVGYLLSLLLRPVRLSRRQAITKRALDLAIAVPLTILTLPVWMVIAVLVRTTSHGSVLFKQVRVGRRGQPFTIYKFRTMIRDAELRLDQLRSQNEVQGHLFKIREDPRVTRVGRWLRKSSLDELPQLLNVLKGDMSLVGPRPPLPSEVALYEDWHRDRLEASPGITGLWQVGGRSELSFDDAVRLDLFYIENWSVVYDLFILGKTIPAVLFRKGAY